MKTGLDRLLERPESLDGRSWGLLSHTAAVDRDLQPGHLALARSGRPPQRLFGPEHGFYGVEQDMVPADDQIDPWTGAEIVSLYGSSEASLVPRPEAFDGLDLLVIDLQDVGARYYTYAASAVWSAEVALAAGCEVWLLDRPNPLGGEVVEGNLPDPDYASFVGAFELPVRHGLTLGELLTLEARRRGWPDGWKVVELRGWRRDSLWSDLDRPWIAPSPNLPRWSATVLYPGLCLVEATELSEGRGTTLPFQLVGAPATTGIDAPALAAALEEQGHPGISVAPAWFKPQYQKHAGVACAGVRLDVVDAATVAAYELGVELIATLHAQLGEAFQWRRDPYEFVTDRPAIDLLTGGDELRSALDSGDDHRRWIDSWEGDELRFADARSAALLYD